MNKVLETIPYVINNSVHVRINKEELDRFCQQIKKEDIIPTAWKTETFYNKGSFEEQVNYIFIFNSLNFCFWSDERWKIYYKNKWHEGSSALFASLTRALEEGNLILNPDFIKNLNEEKFEYILRGKNKIPLFNERLRILKENTSILRENFNSNFLNLIKKADYDCLKIVDILNDCFTSFDDKVKFKERTIYFNKRAQLVAKYSYELFKEFRKDELKNYSQLTGGAEYRNPAVLRYFKVLEYSKELSEKIDNKIEIPSGSEEEIEIRAFSIQAIEDIKEKLNKGGFSVSSPEIHTLIWFKGKTLPSDSKPHHRTLTIWY